MNQLLMKKKNQLTKKKEGFTLVELIIVIAIIAILAAMAIPKFSAVRTDAKVSNDIAAAKNIQSQIAVAIANDDSTITKDNASHVVPQSVLDKLDGKASSGNAEANSKLKFQYSVDEKDDIAVYSGTYQLYPDNDGKNKQAYLTAIKDKKTEETK